MEVVVVSGFDEQDAVAHRAAEHLNGMLEREFGKPILLLLAGGSSLALLDGIRVELLGPHMTITMSDNRVSADPAQNNFAQMMAKPFYWNAMNRECMFIDTRPGSQESAPAVGERFSTALKQWREANPQGVVLMTQGIGIDGHTCGIMPFHDEKKFSALFDNPNTWAVGYDTAGIGGHQFRVTITLPFLRKEVLESVVYVVGWMKHHALKKVLADEQSLSAAPAFIIRAMKKATVFTDQKV